MKTKKPAIIGTFRGKCCDAEIFNNNGMLLDRELFNKLVNSDEYKTAMRNRYYIGFLGHPEDPNDMNFKNACIIMTSMEMLENGEIWGTFDLVDTPVGRIVKAFIDAGVIFGISIRGAGDVDSTGRVDPDTFIFRGYDLVTFPAYNDAVPVFQEIAASSDIQKQSRYKKVCATIQQNLSKIESCEALEIIQSQFNENSNEYQSVVDRIDELNQEDIGCENCSMLKSKLDAMTQLYLQQVEENQKLFDELNSVKLQLTTITSDSDRKIRSLKRITSAQMHQLEEQLDASEKDYKNLERKCASLENKYSTVVNANSKLKDENQRYIASCDEMKNRLQDTQNELRSTRKENRNLDSSYSSIKASSQQDRKEKRNLENQLSNTTQDLNNTRKQLRHSEKELETIQGELESTQQELEDVRGELEETQNSNLIYKEKIESTTKIIADKDKTISDLKSQLHETVVAGEKADQKASNFDETVKNLNEEIYSCQQMIEDYQQAYANLCADAIGVSVDNISVTGKTTARELKNMIFGSTSTSNMPARTSYAKPEQIDILEDEDSYYDDSSIVSL